MVKLKSSPRIFYGRHQALTVTQYLCHKWPRICSVCCNNNPVLSSFMTCHRVCRNCLSFWSSRVHPRFLLALVGFVLFMMLSTFLVPCCEVRCDFRIIQCSVHFWIPFVLKGIHVLFMLFVFIYVFWCQTRYQYQMAVVWFNNNATGITNGEGITYPSGAPAYTPVFSGVRVAQSLLFCVVFYRSLFVLLAIVLSVFLRFTLLVTLLVCINFSWYNRVFFVTTKVQAIS